MELVTCKTEDGLIKVKSIMLLNDFSQIPVVNEEKQVVGCISWRSIGKAEAMNCKSNLVKDYIEVPFVIYEKENFLNHIKKLAEREYAVVINEEQKIVGIITTYDMTMYFYDFINPHLRIGVIENCIRRLIIDSGIEIKKEIDDFTFNEYKKLLEVEENWKRLGISNID
ncbi:CBS domain-containing protein [Mangrovimonas sp. AS39]|uniref:CBS domain-containing protein n=1 Tax=Mangrovimonas futianensis TaxID=2895523 RepID=UPI001E2FDE57|nr:CBS domain-containing protein [Mangrovimonas futianensis]MCF1190107.1 CBS domain-containing protein [Mangrovimonas futianensis]